MKINKVLYYIASMMIITAFFPLTKNLPPVIRSHHVWAALWILSLLAFKTQLFKKKLVVLVIMYGLFILFMMYFVWKKMDLWNKKIILVELEDIFIAATFISYFRTKRNLNELKKITKLALLCIIITSIMTIFTSIKEPNYARDIIGAASVHNDIQRKAVLAYKKYGGGGYGDAAVFMCIISLLIFSIKYNELTVWRKSLHLISIGLIFFALVGIQLSANIAIAIVASFLTIYGKTGIKKVFITLVIIASLLYIFPQLSSKHYYADIITLIGSKINRQKDLKNKVLEASKLVEGEQDMENSQVNIRMSRYEQLFESFIYSPIFGVFYGKDENAHRYFKYNYDYGTIVQVEGTHLHWMNKLTVTGIVGIFIFGFIIYYHIRISLSGMDPKFRYYFLISFLTIVVHGFFKTMAGRQEWYAFFIIIPGCYQLLSEKNYEQNK